MPDPQGTTTISMMADCTIRGIEQVRAALLQAPSSGSEVIIACDGVTQVDLTFVQAIVSARATFAARGQDLVLTSVPDGVRSAFERAAVQLPQCTATQG